MPDYTLELIFIITVASTVIQLNLIKDKLTKKQKRLIVILWPILTFLLIWIVILKPDIFR